MFISFLKGHLAESWRFVASPNFLWRSILWKYSVSLERTLGFWQLGRRRGLRIPQFVWQLLLNPPLVPCPTHPSLPLWFVTLRFSFFCGWKLVLGGLFAVEGGERTWRPVTLLQTFSPIFSPVSHFLFL